MSIHGGVAERLKAPVLKTGEGVSSPWVRIPPPPPFSDYTDFLKLSHGTFKGNNIVQQDYTDAKEY